jgi:hypothetical protein
MSEEADLFAGMISEKELAARLDRTPRMVQNWRYAGVGPPFVQIGRKVLYRLDDVRKWLAAGGAQKGYRDR